MYPPADPWGDRTEPTPMYGRASVPVPPDLREPTAELPVAYPAPPAPKTVKVSWERVKNANRRRLYDGWGFTATGLIVIVSGWVIWAAGSKDSGTVIWPGFVLALIVGAVIFVAARAASYYVLERTLGRARPHARWSHFFAGLFLTLAGVWYLVNAQYELSTGDWLQDGWRWVTDKVDLG